MGIFSKLGKLQKLLDAAKKAKPLLAKMASNDYAGAAKVVATYGDVATVIRKDKVLSKNPEAVQALLAAVIAALDTALPEELLLSVLD